jgi:hypothetical protein
MPRLTARVKESGAGEWDDSDLRVREASQAAVSSVLPLSDHDLRRSLGKDARKLGLE